MKSSPLATFQLSQRQYEAVMDALKAQLKTKLAQAHRNTIHTVLTAMDLQKENPGVRR